jgi:predicted exporter
MRRIVRVVIWIALLGVAGLIIARATFTADMSAFLPAHPSPAQKLLVDELRDGAASRLILMAIDGPASEVRAKLSSDLAGALRAEVAFASIANGAEPVADADHTFVFEHRYLLSPQITPERFAADGLAAAIGDSIDSLASAAGFLARDLLVTDPTGETLAALDALLPAARPALADGVWTSRDGRQAVLLAQTRATGSDTDGQEKAIKLIRSEFSRVGAAAHTPPSYAIRLSGPGVFAVEARASIVHEAIRLSSLSAVLITVLLIAAYRSVRSVVLGLLPVASGALAGTAAVALGFGVVHGVTLGFGVTLIGESVDYSIYLLTQARSVAGMSAADGWIRNLWPTVRLGLLTSLCGFASLLPSGFPGLAQLGLYSMAGLVAAALVTRFVLPALLPERWVAHPLTALGATLARWVDRARRFRRVLWLVPVAAAILLLADRATLWNRDLAALSPIPMAAQRFDARLRGDLGAPDVRDLIVITAPDPDAALSTAGSVGHRLDGLVNDGVLGGYESPARYLPSRAEQERRIAALPPPEELRVRLRTALKDLPLQPARLEPFVAAVAAARSAPPIDRAALDGTSIATGLDALLVRRGERTIAFLPLRAPTTGPEAQSIDTARVRAVLGAAPAGVSVLVLDLKQESERLYSDYLSEAIRLSLLGLLAILLLLAVSLRSIARVARVILPLLLAVLVVLGAFAAAGRSLTILHLIGLLLIVAVGSNYALFFDHRRIMAAGGERTTMLASLCIANLATVLGFGILGLSPVPVLAALGTTVAPGAFAALLFSALLAEPAESNGSADAR